MTSVQQVPQDLLAAMNGVKKASASTVDDAQDRFMTLLVAQMRNQDPLNPLDNAQVTSQLAQLSTVSGIDKLNDTLQSLQASYHASQSMQAAGMIGRGVLVPGDTMQLMEGEAIFGIDLAEAADSVQVRILDAAGNRVSTLDLGARPAGVAPAAWDGKLDDGGQARDGSYKVEVHAVRANEAVAAYSLAFGEVSSVSTGAQSVKLNVGGVGAVSMADVREIL